IGSSQVKTLSLEGRVTRNAGTMQLTSDLELQLEMPDKYWRSDSMTSPVSFQSTSGFNGDQSLSSSNAGSGTTTAGRMMIRMGPNGPLPAGEKPTPEQIAERNKASVRLARTDLSRLMLGWFGMTHPSVSVDYSYAGEAQAPDGKADVIDVKSADGFAARL